MKNVIIRMKRAKTKKEVKTEIEVIKNHSDEEFYCDIGWTMRWVDYY